MRPTSNPPTGPLPSSSLPPAPVPAGPEAALRLAAAGGPPPGWREWPAEVLVPAVRVALSAAELARDRGALARARRDEVLYQAVRGLDVAAVVDAGALVGELAGSGDAVLEAEAVRLAGAGLRTRVLGPAFVRQTLTGLLGSGAGSVVNAALAALAEPWAAVEPLPPARLAGLLGPVTADAALTAAAAHGAAAVLWRAAGDPDQAPGVRRRALALYGETARRDDVRAVLELAGEDPLLLAGPAVDCLRAMHRRGHFVTDPDVPAVLALALADHTVPARTVATVLFTARRALLRLLVDTAPDDPRWPRRLELLVALDAQGVGGLPVAAEIARVLPRAPAPGPFLRALRALRDPATEDAVLAALPHAPADALDALEAIGGERTVRLLTAALGLDGVGRDGGGSDGGGGDGAGRDGSGADGVGADDAGSDGSGADGSASDGVGRDGSGVNGSGADGARSAGSGSGGAGPDGSGSAGSGSVDAGLDGSGAVGSKADGSRADGSRSAGSGSDGSGSGGAWSDGSGTDGSGTDGSGAVGSGAVGAGSGGAGADGSRAVGVRTGAGGLPSPARVESAVRAFRGRVLELVWLLAADPEVRRRLLGRVDAAELPARMAADLGGPDERELALLAAHLDPARPAAALARLAAHAAPGLLPVLADLLLRVAGEAASAREPGGTAPVPGAEPVVPPEADEALRGLGRRLYERGRIRPVCLLDAPDADAAGQALVADLTLGLLDRPGLTAGEQTVLLRLLTDLPRAPHDTVRRRVHPLLRHPDPHVRKHVVVLLARDTDGDGVEAVSATLLALTGPDRDPQTVRRTVEALGGAGARWASDAIAACLDHPTMNIRKTAARALATAGTARAVPHLLRRLGHDDNPGLRTLLLDALRALLGDTCPAAITAAAARATDVRARDRLHAALAALAALAAPEPDQDQTDLDHLAHHGWDPEAALRLAERHAPGGPAAPRAARLGATRPYLADWLALAA
ncbi:HEAT repeat domain-containing protein, partial [Streptomyces sp. NPDC007325]|uniref:HEAT repeat domain-containing protein n=1 Tax=Streptomyces sp. NPDC007325 TaxID=3154588 RepID=UPI0033D9E985